MLFSLNRFRRKLLLTLLIAGASTLLIHSGIQHFSLLKSIENKLENVFYDLNWQLSYLLESEDPSQEEGDWSQVQEKEDRIIIVDIDESSLAELGPYNQWPRSYHAQVVDQLSRGGAVAIAFDILFKNADFGEKEAQRTLQILESSPLKGQSEELWPILKQGFNADSLLIEAVRNSGRVIAGATANSENAYYQSQWKEYAHRDWFERNNPSSGKLSPQPLPLQSWPLLDNIFPELSNASARIGLVNVVADFDGVHRKEPLLHAIPFPATEESGPTRHYPVLSLQTALFIMGLSPEEIELKPEKELRLPPPIHLWKGEGGEWSITTPTITPPMVQALLNNTSALRSLLEKRREFKGYIQVATPVVIYKDSLGQFSADIADGEMLNHRMVQRLIGDQSLLQAWDEVSLHHEEFQLEDQLSFQWSDEEGALLFIDEEEDEEIPLTRYTLEVLVTGKEQVEQMERGAVLHLSSPMRFQWNSEEDELYCNHILFNEPVIRDLIELDSSKLSSLNPGEKIALGPPLQIPLNSDNSMTIRFRGAGKTAFKTLSYSKILKGEIDPGLFQGKIFVLGSTASALFDIVSAPGDRNYPGIMIHANLLDNILRSSFMRQLPSSTLFWIILFFSLLTAFLSNYGRPLPSILLLLLLSLSWLVVNYHFFSHYGLYCGVVKQLFAFLLTFLFTIVLRYIFEEREKQHAVAAFKSYISPELIDQMLESETRPTLGGEKREITAFFTDIQGFSTFSEKIGDASKLVELINEYLTAMTNTLMENGGTLDKYIGDAIVAFFGAPMPLENHARSACFTALAMQKRIAELREKWRAEGDKWPSIVHEMRMRIGINSGEIVTGNMGSSMRMNYTMMGDDVNLAARLESGAKQYGVYTVVSKATLESAGEGMVARHLDRVRVVGKSEPVEIFELLSTLDDMDDSLQELIALWEEAYRLYLETDWDGAEKLFQKTLALEPNHPDRSPGVKSTPSHLYLKRCAEYRTNPPVSPGEKWDGVFTATSK